VIEETSDKNRLIEESELLTKLNTRNVLWAATIIVLSVLPFIIYTLIFIIILEIQLIKRIKVFEKEDLKWLKLKIALKYILLTIEIIVVILSYVDLQIGWIRHRFDIHNLYFPYLLIGLAILQLLMFLLERQTIRKLLKIHETKKMVISPIIMITWIIVWVAFQISTDLLYSNIGWITKVKILFVLAFVSQNIFAILVFGLNIEQNTRWKNNSYDDKARKTLFRNKELK